MLKISFLIFFLAFSFQELQAQDKFIDEDLQEELKDIVKDFKGTAGVYVYNLKTKAEAGINADSVFPTASVIKVPILAGLFKKIEDGQLSLSDTLG